MIAAQWSSLPVFSRSMLAVVGLLIAAPAVLGVGSSGGPYWLIAAIGLLGLGLAGAALPRPDVAVLVLLFVVVTRLSDRSSQEGRVLTLTQLGVGLLLVAVLFQRLVLHREGLVKDRAFGWMLLYAGAIGLSAIGAAHKGDTAVALLRYVREMLIVLVLVNLLTSFAGLRMAAWTLVLAGVIESIVALVQLRTGYDFGGLSVVQDVRIASGTSGTRLAGTIGNANNFGQLLVVLLPLALYRAWDERPAGLRLAALAAAALFSLTLALTFSRAGLIAFVGLLMLVGVMQRGKSLRLLTLAFLALPCFLTVLTSYGDRFGALGAFAARGGPAAYQTAEPASAACCLVVDSVETLQDLSGNELSLRMRASAMLTGLTMFLDHPVTGIGKGRENYYQLYGEYAERVDPAMVGVPRATHSTPIQVAAETGALGLAAFTASMAVVLLGVHQARRQALLGGLEREALLVESIGAGMCAFLITSLFQHDDIFQRYLWIMIGLAIAGRQLILRSVPAGAGITDPMASKKPARAVLAEPTRE